MVRRILLPLVLATTLCVAVLLAVHRPPLASAHDLQLLALLIGLTTGLVAATMLLLVPVALLVRAAALPAPVTALVVVVAGGVIGKALLWALLSGLPLSALLPGAGTALLWLAFNRGRLGR